MRSAMMRFGVLLAGALALGSCGPAAPPPPPPAQAQAAPVAACKVARPPDSLLSLARCCSDNLASNPGCRAYDAADRIIILKDNAADKPAAFLIIPTDVVTGIEDRQIFAPPVRGIWAEGWQAAQHFVGAPPARIAMAINSVNGRSQNQLHIHLACVSPGVAAALAAARIGTDPRHPALLRLGPDRNLYRAVRVHGLAGDASPFDVAREMPGAARDMAHQGVAVIGTSTDGVWYVVDTVARGRNTGSAEELLDQRCAGVKRT